MRSARCWPSGRWSAWCCTGWNAGRQRGSCEQQRNQQGEHLQDDCPLRCETRQQRPSQQLNGDPCEEFQPDQARTERGAPITADEATKPRMHHQRSHAPVRRTTASALQRCVVCGASCLPLSLFGPPPTPRTTGLVGGALMAKAPDTPKQKLSGRCTVVGTGRRSRGETCVLQPSKQHKSRACRPVVLSKPSSILHCSQPRPGCCSCC